MTICPFIDCEATGKTDYIEEMNFLFAGSGQTKEKEITENHQQLLSMLSHRYLPNSDACLHFPSFFNLVGGEVPQRRSQVDWSGYCQN